MGGRGTVLITGASRGLGLELVRQYAATGSRVLACSRSLDAGSSIPGDVHWLPLDVCDPASIQSLADRLAGEPIDILVHNAAIRGATGGLVEVTPDDFTAVMAVNVVGPLILTRELRQNLMAGRRRTVAMISSRAGSMSEGLDADGDYAYRCSKAALNMAARKLGFDDPELTCLIFHPGWIKTDMGGPDAELPVGESARGIIARIDAAGPEDSGTFQTWDGEPIAW